MDFKHFLMLYPNEMDLKLTVFKTHIFHIISDVLALNTIRAVNFSML